MLHHYLTKTKHYSTGIPPPLGVQQGFTPLPEWWRKYAVFTVTMPGYSMKTIQCNIKNTCPKMLKKLIIIKKG